MRISISIKLFLAFFLVLTLSMVPGYWHLRRHLLEQVISSVERDLAEHARHVANRLARVPDAQLDDAARDIAGVLIDRVTIIAPSGQVLGESSMSATAVTHMENHLDRPEVQQALHVGYGSALRHSETKGEPFFYVARPLFGASGAVRGVVRLSRPLGDITGSFQGALTFLYRATGVVASVVLLLSLATAVFGVRPLRRISQAARAYAEGNYAFPLPRTGEDEIGDLAQSMAALGRRIQQVMSDHSADRALCVGLVRTFPLPALLLSPELERREVNALFRDAAGLDPANEDVRIHALCQTADFSAARLTAQELGQPLQFQLALPWQQGGSASALLCPLPASGGRLSWALFLDDHGEAGAWWDPLTKARQRGLQQMDALLSALATEAAVAEHVPAGTLGARLCELRAAADLLRSPDTPPPAAATTLDLAALLGNLLRETRPLAQERRVEVRAELPAAPLLIGDARGFTQRALRAALVRALQRAPVRPDGQTTLSLRVHEDRTCAWIELSGQLGGIECADIDQLLGVLGGGIGRPEDGDGGVLPEGGAEPPPRGWSRPPLGPGAKLARGVVEELWLRVRRA